MEQQADFGYLRNIQAAGFFYPILHADEHALVSDHLADKLKNRIFLPMRAAHYFAYGGWGLGGVLLVVGCVCVYRWRRAAARDRHAKDAKAAHAYTDGDPLIPTKKMSQYDINRSEYA